MNYSKSEIIRLNEDAKAIRVITKEVLGMAIQPFSVEETLIFKSAMKAYTAGKTLADNPYDEHSGEHILWESAFKQEQTFWENV